MGCSNRLLLGGGGGVVVGLREIVSCGLVVVVRAGDIGTVI